MDKFGTIFDSKKISKFYSKVGTKNLALSSNNPVILIIIVEYNTQYLLIEALFLFMAKYPKDMFHFDRRSGKDRRSNKIPGIKSLFIYGRRKKIRRQDDKYKISYFDQYSSALFVAIISILFLNIIDALLTLFLIDRGATEINPIMAYFLNFGPLTFMSVKYFLICFSIIVLLIFNNVFLRKIEIFTRSLFSYAISVFMIVIGWQLFLTFRILF